AAGVRWVFLSPSSGPLPSRVPAECLPPPPPGPRRLAAVGTASRPCQSGSPGWAGSRCLGGAPRARPPRGVVRRRAGRAGPGAQRPAPQPLGLLSLHRPYGAAPRAYPGVPAAAALWNARGGGAAAPSATVGAPARALGHASPRRRRALFGADHPMALPAILSGGARVPSAAHRAAPGVHRHGGDHVVADPFPGARAAPRELPDAAPLPVRPRAADVAGGRADHARGWRAVPVLLGGAAGVGP